MTTRTLTIAGFLLLLVASPTRSQDFTASHLAAASELIQAMGLEGRWTEEVNRLTSELPQLVSDTSLAARVREEMIRDLRPEAEIHAVHSRLYAEQYSEGELRELIAFYRSPLGQKFLRAERLVTAALFRVLFEDASSSRF